MARSNQIGSGGNTGLQLAFETSIKVAISLIDANPYQPESRIEPAREVVERVAESIKQFGLIQTPVVRLMPDGRYQMGDGWVRRCAYKYLSAEVRRLSGKVDWELIPVVIRELTDQQMADLIMEANTVRHDLTPIDLAKFYKKYLESFSVTQAELARQHNCSQGEIANTIRLLELPEGVQQLIISREISETHGRALLPLKEVELINKYAAETVVNGWTVAALERTVKTYLDMHKPETVRSCRVCGCTEGKACVTDGVPCHWVEQDLCSACQAKEQQGAANFAAAHPGLEEGLSNSEGSEETAGSRVGARDDKKNKKPEPPKKAPPAPAKPGTSTKPNTPGTLPSRKLILTEMADGVMAAVTTAKNPFPFMKKIPGTLEENLGDPSINESALDNPIKVFLLEAEAWWNKDSKEGK